MIIETDVRKLLPQDVEFYANRLDVDEIVTEEDLNETPADIEEAARLILPEQSLDSIMYACTSACAYSGINNIITEVQKGKPGTPCTTPVSAAFEALRVLGASKISIVFPYTRDVSEAMVKLFQDNGFEVIRWICMNATLDSQIGRINYESIKKATREIMCKETQAVFFACTALRVVDIIEELEEELGVPMVGANQGMVWHALKLARHRGGVLGFGKLLREF